MKPALIGNNVRANCPSCNGAVTTFEYSTGGGEFGAFYLRNVPHTHRGANFDAIAYRLLKCAGCGKGGLAEIHFAQGQPSYQDLERFFPYTIERHTLPKDVPMELRAEYEEAELCASVHAWRSASAMLRSVLEKTLKANGYDNKGHNLKNRIDQAVADGILTEARSRRAHENIRVLGNDILHDPWREVTQEEFDDAHRYSQRILEDFYDDRKTVEALLNVKGRRPAPTP
jgi:Domain of unknown function (DUF4145)